MLHKIDQETRRVLAAIFFGKKQDSLLGPGVLFAEGKDLTEGKELPHWQGGLIAFGKKPQLPGWQCESYGYVCNADGSIRWLYPLSLRKPVFLRLYNSAGWRGKLFSAAFRLAFLTGTQALMRHGILHVVAKRSNRLKTLVDEEKATAHAIFTGTVGANRKSVVVLQKVDGTYRFCKVPLTASAEKLVLNEATRLGELPADEFSCLDVPRATLKDGLLLLSDVRPAKPGNSDRLVRLHLEALTELACATTRHQKLDILPAWKNLNRNLEDLDGLEPANDLDPKQVGRLKNALLRLRQQFGDFTELPIGLAHADFTPWNLYLSDRKVHLYDWELAEPLPLLYDAFHFIFQTGILLRRQSFAELWEGIESLRQNEKVQSLLRQFDADFDRLYSFYLLNNVAYYLPRYLRQTPLHEQAHWLVSTWLQACEQALEPDQVVIPTSRVRAAAF
ncbi:MAG: hypothetical protein Kow0027_18330 [Saprospiraceae bacterium]